MSCALKILRTQASSHVRNAQSSGQNLKIILENGPFHMGRRCEDGFFKRTDLMTKNIFRAQKANFQVRSSCMFFPRPALFFSLVGISLCRTLITTDCVNANASPSF